jgi:hypothetical protein
MDGEETMASINRFACIAIAVKDQHEALQWFTEKRVDRSRPGIRFLSVSASKQPDLQVLASWFPGHIGKNPTAVFCTDDCQAPTTSCGIVALSSPKVQKRSPFGLQAVFKDLYANSYALLQSGALHG